MPEYLAPGVYVEETSFRPKSIEGVSTSTTAFVGPTRKGPLAGTPEVITSFGEFTRIYGGLGNLSFTQGSDAAPTTTNYLAHAVRSFFENGGARLYIARTFQPRTNALNVVTSDGYAQSGLVVDTAGFTARFRARQPGSGYNGEVRVTQRLSPANVATMAAAPNGTLLRIGGDQIARAATISGVVGPTFLLEQNATLTLALAAPAAPVSIQFQGAAAEVTGTALVEPVNVPADSALSVTVGGSAQTIALTAGNQTVAQLVDTINRAIRHGRAWITNGNQISLGSDHRGTGAAITVADNALLGFAGGGSDTGSGNVTNLEQVTIAEIQALLDAASANTIQVTLPPSTGRITFGTVATGSAATLQAQETPGRTALGLPGTLARGVDGATPSYFLKTNDSWSLVGGANIPVPDTSQPLATTAHIISVSLETEDGDGNLMAFENLGLAPNHPRAIGTILAATPSRKADALQNLYWLSTTGAVSAFALFQGLLRGGSENTFPVTGGNDGAIPASAADPALPAAVAYEEALELLEIIEDISIIGAPGSSGLEAGDGLYRDVQNRLISHAERMKYRIAVLDTRPGITVGEARAARGLIDSTYAAVYYPWITIANPLARPGNDLIPKEITIPPSGAIAGIYARNDVQRGVWKAPANEVVRDALRFEVDINKRQQETLNPEGVNCLRYLSGRGYRVWGARTASSDLEWLYVSVRRYFIYLERSIDVSTQWAVFEPNGPALWANIREMVSNFLYAEWLNGALLGASREEAFFVRCDRSTMTQQDLDLGRLICEIGVAVVKPAEFVIFRIGQKTADARG